MGKQNRMERITEQGRMLCIPLDHGVSLGPVKGLDTIWDTIQKVEEGGATSILSHKGILKSLPRTPKIGMIMHASASTSLGPAPNRKVRSASVEEAILLGADAVSVHVNIGCKEEPEMLEKLGSVSDECDKWQMPFIAMMYPRGENIKNAEDAETVAHVARIGAELGADIVKTVYTGDVDSFHKVIAGCPVPVVVAGGPKTNSDESLLKMAYEAMEAGAIGVTFGRNVFQHSHPDRIVRALSRIVLEGRTPKESLEIIENV
jgi:fructose-bisphosphate aldolase/2-amino-3,7-dideoxy-D-threo-hept-6-ulosonate synthase